MHTGIFYRRIFVCMTMVLALLVALLGAAAFAAGGNNTKGYDYYVTGNPADAASASPPTVPTLALMGGGPFVDEMFKRMIQKSGGGDFVIIRASGTDADNAYIYGLGQVDSVETLVIKTRAAASDPFVIAKIRNAEALFIAGGDQSNYINFWKGTPVEDAIHELVLSKVPVGGTSAGIAIMGQFVFSAQNGSVYSDSALADPYNKRVTLDRDFLSLPELANTITDSHFGSRDRMGRLVSFLARIVQDGWSLDANPTGIGVDEGTAIVVEDGIASRFGSGSVYFLSIMGSPQVCKKGVPLTYRNLSVQRMSAAGTFNLRSWRSQDSGTTTYSLSAENGVLLSNQAGGAIY